MCVGSSMEHDTPSTEYVCGGPCGVQTKNSSRLKCVSIAIGFLLIFFSILQ